MRDLQISVAGAIAQEQRLSVLANNLANANTVGFKKDREVFQAFLATPDPDVIAQANPTSAALPPLDSGGSPERVYVKLAGTFVDQSQGILHPTNNPFDLAIEGTGFFVVDTPEGERYTRAGNFRRNGDGQLVTQDGDVVRGESGAIQINSGQFAVAEDGSVIEDGRTVGRITVVQFDDPRALVKSGRNLFQVVDGRFAPRETSPQDLSRVRQHVIEQSNVNMVDEMVRLIGAERAYQMSTKALETADRTYQQTIQMHLNG